jgi:hypothetical protein
MLSSCKNALGKVPPAQRLPPRLLFLRGKPAARVGVIVETGSDRRTEKIEPRSISFSFVR